MNTDLDKWIKNGSLNTTPEDYEFLRSLAIGELRSASCEMISRLRELSQHPESASEQAIKDLRKKMYQEIDMLTFICPNTQSVEFIKHAVNIRDLHIQALEKESSRNEVCTEKKYITVKNQVVGNIINEKKSLVAKTSTSEIALAKLETIEAKKQISLAKRDAAEAKKQAAKAEAKAARDAQREAEYAALLAKGRKKQTLQQAHANGDFIPVDEDNLVYLPSSTGKRLGARG